MKQFVFLISKKTATPDNPEVGVIQNIVTVSSHYEASVKAQELAVKDIQEKFRPVFPIGQYKSMKDMFNVSALEKCPAYIECPGGRFNAFADENCFGYYNTEEGSVKYTIEKVPFEEL